MAASLRVLIADDSKSVHSFFTGVLARWPQPIELVNAYDGRQCMDALDRGNIELAFIDVNMPEMSGLEAVGAARYHGIKTFVTLMSIKISEARFEVARQLKAYEFLAKPFGPADVESVLRTYQRVSTPTRALIVDDSSTVRRMVQKIMAGSIFKISTELAMDGATAFRKFTADAYDIVFLDCNMPGLTGLDTLVGLREFNPKAKVIMISSEHSEERIRVARQLGAVEFLDKPFDAKDIDRVLHLAYDLPQPGLSQPGMPWERMPLSQSA